jgi:hypothetical protein
MSSVSKFYICSLLLTVLLISSCGKDEEPVPDELFVGNYVLVEVIEEYNPTDPNRSDEKFLAPELFTVSKSDVLNPITGEMVTTYKFLINDIFMGLAEQSGSGGDVLVGTAPCPNDDDLEAVSISLLDGGMYQLNMFNCIRREVIADYNRTLPE